MHPPQLMSASNTHAHRDVAPAEAQQCKQPDYLYADPLPALAWSMFFSPSASFPSSGPYCLPSDSFQSTETWTPPVASQTTEPVGTTELRTGQNITPFHSNAACFVMPLLQLLPTPWTWAHLKAMAAFLRPTANVEHSSRQRWTCRWTIAKALCCRMTSWTLRMTWTLTWMTLIRQMKRTPWSSSLMATSWNGKVSRDLSLTYSRFHSRHRTPPSWQTPDLWGWFVGGFLGLGFLAAGSKMPSMLI